MFFIYLEVFLQGEPGAPGFKGPQGDIGPKVSTSCDISLIVLHLFTFITLQSFREGREMRDSVEFKEDLEKGFGHAFSSFSVRTAMRLIP